MNNRTLKEVERTLMLAGGFESEVCAEAINTAVSTLNRTGTSSTKGVTPIELWLQKNRSLEDLHILGRKRLFTYGRRRVVH